MPERMSLTLVDSSPITLATSTSPPDAHTRPPLLRGPRDSSGRGHGPSGLTWVKRRRVQSVNQPANHSGARSGAHS
jgi:hypothetical protein